MSVEQMITISERKWNTIKQSLLRSVENYRYELYRIIFEKYGKDYTNYLSFIIFPECLNISERYTIHKFTHPGLQDHTQEERMIITIWKPYVDELYSDFI